ncbi:MAG: NUDIX domain-containing protein [Haloarculaceae archaeon]
MRALATDGVVLTGDGVVLLERDHPPHEGEWVLPGGLVEADETAAEACAREVREEIGLSVRPVQFVGLYDDPDRDERGNVSAAYLCVPVDGATPEPREEARRVDTFRLAEHPPLGFDHDRILADALDPTRG